MRRVAADRESLRGPADRGCRARGFARSIRLPAIPLPSMRALSAPARLGPGSVDASPVDHAGRRSRRGNPPAVLSAAPTRPNVLLYVVDTLRADALRSYGNEAASTPHFDAFAAQGVLFENAWANASWTRASVATLLTGLYPWRHRAEGRLERLPEAVTTLGEVLRAHGYATALVTSNPNVGNVFGFDQAFDRVIELYRRRDPGIVRGSELITPSDVVTAEALEWLRSAGRPFFLVVLSTDPHAPYHPPQSFDPQRVPPDQQLLAASAFSARRTPRRPFGAAPGSSTRGRSPSTTTRSARCSPASTPWMLATRRSRC